MIRALSRTVAAGIAASIALAGPSAAEGSTPVPVRLATGEPEGVYYEVGSRLQRRVNANLGDHGVLISTETSPGSQENVRRLLAAEVDLAIVQEDVLADANARHVAKPLGDRRPPLTTLAMLLDEWLVIVVRDRGPVSTPDGLSGRRVALGEPGSGTRFTATRALASAGVAEAAMRVSPGASASARADLFCAGRVDAAAFVFAVPNPVLKRLVDRCGARLLAFDDPAVRTAAAEVGYRVDRLPPSAGAGGVATVKVRAALAQLAMHESVGAVVLDAALGPAGAAGLNRVRPDGWTLEDAAAIAPLPAAEAAKIYFGALGLAGG